MKNIFIILIIIVTIPLFVNAQVKNKGVPYIINYSRDDYKASTQNWAAVQDKRGVLYFGNTRGVLEFDGQNWNLIPLTNGLIARSLAVDDKGRIFVGGRKEFGYLKADSVGKLSYISLVEKIIKEEDRSFKQDISNILFANGAIFFISRGGIFKYDNEKLEFIKNKKLQQAYEIDDKIFVKEQNVGITELINGEFKLVADGERLKNASIRAVLPYKGKYLFVTLNNGLYLYDNKSFEKLNTPIDEFLKGKKIITCIQLKNGEYAFGMFTSGLLLTDKNLKPVQLINANVRLQNNQVNSIFQDNRLNIWLGLANGISEVLTSLPITLFGENYGLSGTVNSSKLYNEHLYIGTSRGVFSKEWLGFENHFDTENTFSKVGDPVQVFSIDTSNNTILIAHGLGISTTDASVYNNVELDKTIVYRFLMLNKNLAIAGTKKGLLLLDYKSKKERKIKKRFKKKNKKTKREWVFRHKIKGFNESCRHIQIDNDNNVWYSAKAKNVARLSLNETLDSVFVRWYKPEDGIPENSDSRIFNIDNKIIVGTESGLYCYNKESDSFYQDTLFNEILGVDIKIELFIEDQLGNIWFKLRRKEKHTNASIYEMGELIRQDDGSYYLNKTPFYKLRNNVYSISPISANEVIIGGQKGFVHFDTKILKDHYKPYYALLREVKFVSNDSIIFSGTNVDSLGNGSLFQEVKQVKLIPFQLNDIRFSFSAPFYDEPEKIKFKFYLEGNDKSWSDWKTESYKEYSNLREGEYIFHVLAKNIYEVESVEATYKFTILPPWFRTIWAYILYVIGVALLIWGIVRLSVRRLRKQKEYLEMVVKERTAEINQAKEEIEATNEMLQESNEQINAKNKSITASITYAKRIQEAMLPLKDRITQSLEKSFILFKPRDIVSGDFYWFAEKKGKIIIAAVDCTGHGVPGAFMSMIGSEILTTIVSQGVTQPSKILDLKNDYVHKALKQDQTDNQDGMDMTLCTIDKEEKIVEFAGAKNPLVYIQNGELFQIKGDKQSIGGRKTTYDKPFANHRISYAEHKTYFYIFSDGFQDQFGGMSGRKFMVKRMKNLFLEHHLKSMREQEKILNYTIEGWMKDVQQTDDIIVIGFALEP